MENTPIVTVEIVGLIKELLEIVEANEWQHRHAAENTYCPFCSTAEEFWEDQIKHHHPCKFVETVYKAKSFLRKIEQ